jgi:hypothetical protein
MKKRKQVDEDNRKLSAAEQRRLAHLEEISKGLLAQGYRRTDLTIGILWANAVVIAAAFPTLFLLGGLFFLCNRPLHLSFTANSILSLVLFLALYFALIVVHELVHGITWAIYAEHHWKDIEFGVMWQLLTPYCTCKVPLKKGQYIIGGLMPLIVLGIVPYIVSLWVGSLFLFLIAYVMILSAGGDVLLVLKLCGYKTNAKEVLIYDHPTKAGSIIFER